MSTTECFAVRQDDLIGRIDPHFYKPSFQSLLNRLKKQGAVGLAEIVSFQCKMWDQKDGRFGDTFPYIEISSVGLGNNEYEVAQVNIAEAPSRARLVVRSGDIIVSLTRPQRGAIARIRAKDDGIIASTGFAVLHNLLRNDLTMEYLRLALSSSFVLNQMLMRSSGGNYPAITEDELGKVLLPCPGLEQANTLVTEMETALAARQAKLAQADALLYSLDDFLLNIFGLKTPLAPKAIFAIHNRDLLGMLNPDRYRAMQLERNLSCDGTVGDIGTFLDARCSPEKEAPEELWDWIRIDDLPNQPWQVETVRTEKGANISGSFFEVQENDILIARLGPTILNAKFVLCPRLQRRTVASAEFLVIRCHLNWEPAAVLWLLRTKLYRDIMYLRSRGGTPSRFRLDGSDLSAIPFPKIEAAVQTVITSEVKRREEEARRLRAEVEAGWENAKRWFEEQLLGPAQV